MMGSDAGGGQNSTSGIVKFFRCDLKQALQLISSRHLCSVGCPKADRIRSSMAIRCDGEVIASRFEDGVDLVMSGKEALCLPR